VSQAPFLSAPSLERAVGLEQSRGSLLFTLSKYANLVLYPVHGEFQSAS
jgi:hypothetical protein